MKHTHDLAFDGVFVDRQSLQIVHAVSSAGAGALYGIITNEEAVRLLSMANYSPTIIEDAVDKIGDALGYAKITDEEASLLIEKLREASE